MPEKHSGPGQSQGESVCLLNSYPALTGAHYMPWFGSSASPISLASYCIRLKIVAQEAPEP